MTPADIDGMVTFTLDTNDELLLMRCLGIPELRYWSRTPHGGGGRVRDDPARGARGRAAARPSAVLVYRAFNERSGRRFGQPNAPATPPAAGTGTCRSGSTRRRRCTRSRSSATCTQYGLTNEDFGRYTVVARQHAATNPNAWFYERPITLEDHQDSRWIVEPILRLLDCCQESDGGVALVVTRADRRRDLAAPGARSRAVADAAPARRQRDVQLLPPRPRATSPRPRSLARQLYARPGSGPTDIDAAMLYENFSPVVFLQLEALGFCGPGEARTSSPTATSSSTARSR